ncbi:MAG TPA: ketosteroid isomerase-related protein [Polyangiaceae bacterium]|jgi:steroid delta-isomerase-like uncharacterized protein|nr:ketosteroid isomerase-related protein [Polyangiaceae bacterium]
MSREQTLAILEQYYAAFNAEEDEQLLTLLSDRVAHEINQGGREIGKQRFRAFLARMRGCYREQVSNLVYCFSEDGARAGVEYVVTGTYLHTDQGLPEAHGQTYEVAGGAFFEIEGGLITRVTNYYNLEAWLRQIR